MNYSFIKKAQKQQKKILFPETEDKRVLKAIVEIINKNICHPVMIGNAKELFQKLQKYGLKTDKKYSVIPKESKEINKKLIQTLHRAMKRKGLTPKSAQDLLKQDNYFATTCLAANFADGMIYGAATTTANVLRPALQIIRPKRNKHVSGAFLIKIPNSNYKSILFADCAVTPDPSSKELAKIAFNTAEIAKILGIKPRLAFLSFSSHGSAALSPQAEKVRLACRFFKKRHAEIICDGEIQADAALCPKVAKLKTPNSPLHGQANILIFPNLEAANIGYKLIERLAKAEAIGTIIQGLNKPINDLSRGCSEQDIINLTAITVLQTMTK